MASRSPAWLVAAVAPVTLLAVDPAGWYPFGPVAWLAVSTLVPLGAALLFARRPLRVRVRPTAVGLGLVAWLAVAAALGDDRLYAWVGTPERHLGVFAWGLAALALIAGQSLGEDDDRRTVAAGLVVAGLGVGVVAVAESLGWEPGVLDVSSRLSGTLGSPAYLGAAAALLLPALAGLAADPGWGRRARVAAAAGGGGLAVAAIGSGARAAWVGLAVATAVTVWMRREGLRDRVAVRRRTVALAAVVGALAVGALVVFGPVGARVAATFDADAPGGRGRLDEWRVAGRVAVDHPVVGVGPEGYRIAFADGVDAAYEQAHGRDPQPDRAHSTPLDLALAGGLPAVAAWAVLVALVARPAGAALRDGPRWLAGIAAGLVAHVVGGLLLFPVVELAPLAWLLGGLLLATAPAGGRIVERAVPRTAVGLLVVVAVIAAIAGAVDVTADRHARRAADALAAGDGATAADEAAAAVALRPDEVRLHLLDSRARVADQQGYAAGLDAVDRALALSPGDPIARRERARLLVLRADATRAPDHIDAARDELADMLAEDPVSSVLWDLASAAAALDGDEAAAADARSRAGDLRPPGRDGT